MQKARVPAFSQVAEQVIRMGAVFLIASIWLESGSRRMNAKSLLGIMSLGVVTGTTVTLSASGPDAEAAVNALDELLQRDVY